MFDHLMQGIAGLGHVPSTLIQIDPFMVKGEEGTGYEKPADLGEFECANCSFYDARAGACNQSTMKALSKQPRLADGRVSVDAEGCCEYVDRMGKKESSEESHE